VRPAPQLSHWTEIAQQQNGIDWHWHHRFTPPFRRKTAQLHACEERGSAWQDYSIGLRRNTKLRLPVPSTTAVSSSHAFRTKRQAKDFLITYSQQKNIQTMPPWPTPNRRGESLYDKSLPAPQPATVTHVTLRSRARSRTWECCNVALDSIQSIGACVRDYDQQITAAAMNMYIAFRSLRPLTPRGFATFRLNWNTTAWFKSGYRACLIMAAADRSLPTVILQVSKSEENWRLNVIITIQRRADNQCTLNFQRHSSHSGSPACSPTCKRPCTRTSAPQKYWLSYGKFMTARLEI